MPDMNPAVRAGEKSPAAFRTITEVASELDLPQHVLRFWETKFPQIKPLKRRGGRRYYRPEDIAVLRRIRSLLHAEGYTIKGAQKLLRERISDRESAGVARKPETAVTLDVANIDAVSSGALDPAKRQVLESVLRELEELRALLEKVRPTRR